MAADAVFQRLGGVIEELQLVGRPGGASLGAGPVVGHHHDQRVVELAGLLQEIKYPAELVVGVRQEPGVHLHQAHSQTAGVR